MVGVGVTMHHGHSLMHNRGYGPVAIAEFVKASPVVTRRNRDNNARRFGGRQIRLYQGPPTEATTAARGAPQERTGRHRWPVFVPSRYVFNVFIYLFLVVIAIVVTPVPSRVDGGSDVCPVCVVGDLERSSVSVVYDHRPQVTTTTAFPP